MKTCRADEHSISSTCGRNYTPQISVGHSELQLMVQRFDFTQCSHLCRKVSLRGSLGDCFLLFARFGERDKTVRTCCMTTPNPGIASVPRDLASATTSTTTTEDLIGVRDIIEEISAGAALVVCHWGWMLCERRQTRLNHEWFTESGVSCYLPLVVPLQKITLLEAGSSLDECDQIFNGVCRYLAAAA